MRDTLPSKLNLDISKNNGTHWVCYYKNKDKCYYFDSFGLDPPLELPMLMSFIQNYFVKTFRIINHLCL
jgi:hypothetical protein